MKNITLFALAVLAAGCLTLGSDGNSGVEPERECSSDAECGVGGCSGQICGNAEFAENVITTCEYQEIYSCYAATSCGCAENRCEWVETQEYLNCVAELQ